MTLAFMKNTAYRLFSYPKHINCSTTLTIMPFRLVALISCIMAFSLPAYAACNPPKTYYKNLTCTSSSQYFLASTDVGKPVALLDSRGKKVADLMPYAQVDVDKISNGLLPVQKKNRVGYVNLKGREVIPAVYDLMTGDQLTSGWARAASDNRIIVKKGDKIGIIDTNGKVILPFSTRYSSISDYNNGLAEVFKGGSRFWINKSARKTSNPNTPASNKPAMSSAPLNTTRSQPVQQQTQTRSSRLTAPAEISEPASNASYPTEIWKPANRDGKWGFVNTSNVPMITFSFDGAEPFSEGLAGVRVADNWGFVDLTGDLVIPFRFDEAGVIRQDGPNYKASYHGKPPFNFVDGKAWIGNLRDNSKLCIDKLGTNVSCYKEGEVNANSTVTAPINPMITAFADNIVSSDSTIQMPIANAQSLSEKRPILQPSAAAINVFTNTPIMNVSSSLLDTSLESGSNAQTVYRTPVVPMINRDATTTNDKTISQNLTTTTDFSSNDPFETVEAFNIE